MQGNLEDASAEVIQNVARKRTEGIQGDPGATQEAPRKHAAVTRRPQATEEAPAQAKAAFRATMCQKHVFFLSQAARPTIWRRRTECDPHRVL